jgi:AcrR family transcriptional regulator
MQYLKDDVKDNIIKAALKEFSEKGYRDSSMRVIARNADIVMGNIYRYFKNKETLFNSTVGPIYEQIAGISAKVQAEIETMSGPWEDDQAIALIKRLYNQILETFSGHGTEILILLDKSGGSPYENTKKELIAQIQSVLETRLTQEVKLDDPFIFFVLASAFVEGICAVLRDTGNHDKEALIGSLANIVLCQISKRI